jgi:hypothetical protein
MKSQRNSAIAAQSRRNRSAIAVQSHEIAMKAQRSSAIEAQSQLDRSTIVAQLQHNPSATAMKSQRNCNEIAAQSQ